jgi:hypothetical protein
VFTKCSGSNSDGRAAETKELEISFLASISGDSSARRRRAASKNAESRRDFSTSSTTSGQTSSEESSQPSTSDDDEPGSSDEFCVDDLCSFIDDVSDLVPFPLYSEGTDYDMASWGTRQKFDGLSDLSPASPFTQHPAPLKAFTFSDFLDGEGAAY